MDTICHPGDIEFYVANYIRDNKELFKNKVCIDSPAGQGVTSRVLHEVGADVKAYDIFPEYFKFDKVNCEYADLTKKIPLEDNSADIIICQEGFEHICDQEAVFKEFNRVLKNNGRLFVTVPNYSNIKSRLSYLLFESECYGREMPCNEVDTIWHVSNNNCSGKIYYGHAFLSGVQKLRFLGKVCGFSIVDIIKTKLNKTSLYFFPLFFPFIYFVSLRTYLYAKRKGKESNKINYKSIYKECFEMNINYKVLLCKNLFIEFRKIHTILDAKTEIAENKESSPWESVSNKQKLY